MKKSLLAIDPGNKESAFCLMDRAYNVIDKGKVANALLLDYIFLNAKKIRHLAVEMIASMGMAVGAEVFETCVMIGKIEQLADAKEIPRSRVFRKDEKLMICHDSRAKDINIRRALIERFAKHDLANGKGTKKNPDHFYGFKADIWAAFAVGTVYLDTERRNAGEAV
jgi:hypothetical protein